MNGRDEIKARRQLLDKLEVLEDELDALDEALLPLKVGDARRPYLQKEAVDALNIRLRQYGYRLTSADDGGNS